MLDELVFGAREAAWPLIRSDLGLNYVDIGLLLTVPSLVAALIEPGLAVLGDTRFRRRVIVGGGLAFAVSVAAFALAPSYAALLAASVILYPASGAFVALSQATLTDLDPGRRERGMARWVAAGSVGAMGGPLLLTVGVRAGLGWRLPLIGLAAVSLPLVAGVRWVPVIGAGAELVESVRGTLSAMRRGAVLRWLGLLQLTDLMGDVLFGYLALYFVDVVRVGPVMASTAVLVWGAGGLAGDLALLRILRTMDGLTYLRRSAAATLVAYAAFLLPVGLGWKLGLAAALGFLRAGWYAIPQARLYDEMAERSGAAVGLSSLADAAGRLVPLGLGALAARFGLGPAMWVLLAAPVGLLLGLPAAGPAGSTRVDGGEDAA